MATWWIWISMAMAAPPAPGPIELGQDLADWRNLAVPHTQEGLLGFLENHPQSPLAERAWDSLLVQNPDQKPLRSWRGIVRSHSHHQKALSQTKVIQHIAVITPDKQTTQRPGLETPK